MTQESEISAQGLTPNLFSASAGRNTIIYMDIPKYLTVASGTNFDREPTISKFYQVVWTPNLQSMTKYPIFDYHTGH